MDFLQLMIKFFNFLVRLAFCSLLFSACDAKPPADMTDPGQLIYLGYTNKQANCSRCHGAQGQGGMFGPKIRGVLQKKGARHVREMILYGDEDGEDKMPPLADELSAEQVTQVLQFLSTWQDSSATARPAPE